MPTPKILFAEFHIVFPYFEACLEQGRSALCRLRLTRCLCGRDFRAIGALIWMGESVC
jgi:hypothetical protein